MRLIRSGQLDRRVTFQRPVADEAFDGAGSATWEPVATDVPAQVQDVLPSRAEKLSGGMSITTRPARIRIRYDDDITSDMRILYGNRIMQIVAGPVELGRREGMELIAEDYSPTGNPA